MKRAYIYFFILLLVACNNTDSKQSKVDYEAFCLLLEQAVNDKNDEFVDLVYDFDNLVNEVTKGIEAPEYYENGFKEGFKKTYTPGIILLSSLGEDGYYKFLRMKSDNPPVGLFRVVSEMGVNYHEIHLNTDEEGDIVIEDFYSYLEAELFSQGIRRLYIINLASEVEDFDHPIAEALPVISEVAMLADGGKQKEAFEKIMALPKSVLKQKIVLLIMLTLGNDLGKESLEVAAKKFKELYPDDPLINLKMMEFSFLARDTAQILNYIGKVQSQIGYDPYLQMLKATVIKDKQAAEAKKLLYASLEKEPENDEFYWVLFDLLIQEKEYDKTIEWFGKMKEQFDENPADYLIYDGYQDFYKSTPYLSWVKENPLHENPNLEIDSLLKMFEKMRLEQEEHDHNHGHNHHGHSH